MIKPSVQLVRGKNFISNVNIVAGKIKSITLALPVVREKDTYLMIRLPEQTLTELLEKSKLVPKPQRKQFIQNWLMKNQQVALDYYMKSGAKDFTYDSISVQLNRISLIPEKVKPIPRPIIKEDKHVISVLPKPTLNLTKIGQANVSVPLIIDLERVGVFHFTVKLKLGQLSDTNISTTIVSIISILQKQIAEWAANKDINTRTKEFQSALGEAMLTIAPNIREQVRRLKLKHPEWKNF
jgi:hypothetical protein